MTATTYSTVGNIFTRRTRVEGKLMTTCRVCGATLKDNPLGKSAHGRKHVRDGSAAPKVIFGFDNMPQTIYVVTATPTPSEV